MFDVSQIEITTEKETADFGKFIIEPLTQGYGHTIGNSLRRTLLDSLEGAAITQAKVSGVRHQYTALSGMSEDIIEFILNLKKVRLKIAQDKPVKLTLDARGPKQVKAKDMVPSAGVQIVNGDITLAHLSDSKARLTCQLIAERGTGYSLANDRRTGEIGVIPIDANFTPVTMVNYKVEATRVGRVANFDKITLEITTDGTVKPSEALKQAAKILIDHLTMIYEPKPGAKKQKTIAPATVLTEDFLKTSLEELDLPVRLTNSLKLGKIETIGEFLDRDKKELIKMKNVGPKSISLVEEKLKEKGIEVK